MRCFVDVAQVMGLRTVAEWVDNADVYERLRELGIDYAQGFLLHRPEPLDELLHADARFAMGSPARSGIGSPGTRGHAGVVGQPAAR